MNIPEIMYINMKQHFEKYLLLHSLYNISLKLFSFLFNYYKG